MLALGDIGHEPIDARRFAGRIELDDRNLFQPDFTTIRPPVAECDRSRGLVRTSTFEAGYQPRLVFGMYMLPPFSLVKNFLRVETEDPGRILAKSYFVGRHVPVEGYNSAGPQRVLVIGFREASAR